MTKTAGAWPGPPRSRRRERGEREVYRGYEGYVHLPEDVAHVVEGVFGLDNRRMARRAVTPLPTITPLTPPQVATLYDFPKPSNHIDKETIGLLEFSDPVAGKCGYLPSDIVAYFTTAAGIGPGFVTPPLLDIGVNGATNSPGGFAHAEVVLDISVAGSVAQGAHIQSTSPLGTRTDGCSPSSGRCIPIPASGLLGLSISWDWSEFDTFGNLTWSPAVIATVSAAFQEAAMFGMTVLVASGDDGSNCQVGDGERPRLLPGVGPLGDLVRRHHHRRT